MKVALVYPPDRCLPTIPYSSLACLKACLRTDGHEVSVHDLNAEVFHWLNRRERLEEWYDEGTRRLSTIEQRECLDEPSLAYYRFIAPLMAAPRDSILRGPDAAEIMRDPLRFYDPDIFNQAFDDLQNLLRFLYAANPVFDPENRFFVGQVMAAVRGELGDPLVEACRHGALESLLAEKPDLIGFTLPFSNQFYEMLKIVRLIKQRAPSVKIVIGGPTVNDYAYRLFETPELFELIDFAVAGEGERAITGLVAALQNGTPFDQVPNLYFCATKESSKKIHPWGEGFKVWEELSVGKSALPPDVPDLNLFPSPDFTGIQFDLYLSPERIANLQTSRGCYYGKCTFCGDGFRRNFRLRAPQLIYDDIKKIHQDSNIDFFLFWDSLAPPKTLRHIARSIRDHGDSIQWFAETKFEKPYTNPELIRELADGGCRFLQFGFESGSERVLDLIDKGNDLVRVDTILALMKTAGIRAGVSWFIGFPTETPEEALSTYDFVHQRQDRVALSVYAGTFILGRDTLVYAHPDRFGIRILEQEDGGIDFEMQDGARHYDRTELDNAFKARGDLPLLNHGGYLLYAANCPERLRAITGQGRRGSIATRITNLGSQVPRLSDGVRIMTYRFNPFAPDLASAQSPARVAYYSKTGMHFPLEPVEEEILRCVEQGGATIDRIVERLEPRHAGVRDRACRMVDRGLLSLEGARVREESLVS